VKKKAAGSALRRFPTEDGDLGSCRLGLAPRRLRAVLDGQRSVLGAEESGERYSRVGQELGGCRGRGGEWGLSVAATRDKGATRTWRRRLHGLRVEWTVPVLGGGR
jgi:hypothetical protein